MALATPLKKIAGVSAAVLLAATASLPAPALAQSAEDAWKFRAQLYLWLPSVDGKVEFPTSSTPSGSLGANVNFSDYFSFSNLDGMFMGAFEVRKGRWGAITDFIYLDFNETLSGSRNFSINAGPGGRFEIPGTASADSGLRLRGWEWTLAGTYAFVDTPDWELQALAGVRYLKVDATFDWTLRGSLGSLPPQAASGNTAVKPDYWDGIVGVRGRWNLGKSWFVPFYLDAGTGESQFTWQAMAGVGYRYRWLELLAAYRHLDYKFDSSSPVRDLSFSGPAVSLGVTW